MKVILIMILSGLLVLALTAFQQPVKPTTGTLEGVVRDLEGKPITEATVLAAEERVGRSRRFKTITDSNGKFVLSKVAPGEYVVKAYKESAGIPDAFTSFHNTPTSKKSWRRLKLEAGQT